VAVAWAVPPAAAPGSMVAQELEAAAGAEAAVRLV
jgi:hypothetical protein